MRIQHNIAAANAARQLGGNNTQVSKNLEKLSSGYKINRAGDDAAGLAISEKMRSQIRGLETAQKNANDGVSLVQTAEGALTEVHSMLNRMVELATQSSNGTYTDNDRAKLQAEVTSLNSEIDRIADSTNFNGIKLLDGSLGKGTYTSGLTVGTDIDTNKVIVTDIKGSNLEHGTYTLAVGKMAGTPPTFTGAAGAGAATDLVVQVSFKDATTGDVKNTVLNLADILSVKDNTGAAKTITADGAFKLGTGETATIDLSSVGIGVLSVSSANTSSDFKTIFDNITTKIGTTSVGTPSGTGSLNLQVGDTNNTYQQVSVNVGKMSSTALAINTVNVGTEAGAKSAISAVNKAIETVSKTRSDLGAVQNRLEHTINNLGVTTENMSAAESRIRDVDMAKEMMDFTKNNILTQAAQAMLAQANQLPQGVLQLLR